MQKILMAVLAAAWFAVSVFCGSARADCFIGGVKEGEGFVTKFDDQRLYLCKSDKWVDKEKFEKTKITVLDATYGGPTKRDSVIGKIKASCDLQDRCSFPVNNAYFGDPQPGPRKTLEIQWKCGDNNPTSAKVDEDNHGLRDYIILCQEN